MQWVLQHAKTFLHPHYISNLLLALLFFGLKTIEPLCDVIFENCELELVSFYNIMLLRIPFQIKI